jgi:hypothetical protein
MNIDVVLRSIANDVAPDQESIFKALKDAFVDGVQYGQRLTTHLTADEVRDAMAKI